MDLNGYESVARQFETALGLMAESDAPLAARLADALARVVHVHPMPDEIHERWTALCERCSTHAAGERPNFHATILTMDPADVREAAVEFRTLHGIVAHAIRLRWRALRTPSTGIEVALTRAR
jgi:hypothetical protein